MTTSISRAGGFFLARRSRYSITKWVAKAATKRRMMRELSMLDDHLLDDIGLGGDMRNEVEHHRNSRQRPFYYR